MKKYLAILLAVVMVLGAVACTKTPAAETPATEQPAAEAPATRSPLQKARPTSNWLPTMRLSRATPTVFVTRLTSRKLLLLPQTTV